MVLQKGAILRSRHQTVTTVMTEVQSRLFVQILSVLGNHLSRISAKVALEKACQRSGLQPREIDGHHLDDLVAYLKPSLSLFLNRADRTRALGELQSLVHAGQGSGIRVRPVIIEIRAEQDIDAARSHALKLARAARMGGVVSVKVATVVSELARNILQHAQRGVIELEVITKPHHGIRVVAQDHGPGIPHLDKLLSGLPRSSSGSGFGLLGSRRLMDRFDIQSSPESGTTVTTVKFA